MSLHKQNIKESSTAHIFENHYKNMMITWAYQDTVNPSHPGSLYAKFE